MSDAASLEALIALIRDHQRISAKTEITVSSRLEKDLGITGDDGIELLAAVQKRFAISFSGADGSLRHAFGLTPNQTLFHSEGFHF